MSTTTTRVALYKPDATGIENINVVTDVNNNMDKIDSLIGFVICTSGTRPGSPYAGEAIYETDTGKAYVCTSTGPAVWTQLLIGTASFANGIITAGSISAAGAVAVTRSTSGSLILNGKVTGDTVERFAQQADGLMAWGPGGATARDTNLYRSGVDALKTDDSFNVGGALTVVGASSVDDISIAGNLNIGSARYRNQLSSSTTVSNTTAETVVASMTIPANDAVVGAVYRITGWGIASCTGTPNISLKTRLGGLAGTALSSYIVACRSGMTDGRWRATCWLSVTATGGTGGWKTVTDYLTNFFAGTPPYTLGIDIPAAAITNATTSSQDFVITMNWGAASASNIFTCTGFVAERVA